MATRRQVREAFYTELETSVSAYLSADDIRQEYPDDEDLPALVHNDNYRPIPMNFGTGPTSVTTDADGEQTYTYTSMMQAQFDVLVAAADESTKEDIYEALRDHFEPYEHPIKDASNLQTDVTNVDVDTSNSSDQTDREPVARGDVVSIQVDYKRHHDRDVDPTTAVDHSVDVDDDGTAEETYTTI